MGHIVTIYITAPNMQEKSQFILSIAGLSPSTVRGWNN